MFERDNNGVISLTFSEREREHCESLLETSILYINFPVWTIAALSHPMGSSCCLKGHVNV